MEFRFALKKEGFIVQSVYCVFLKFLGGISGQNRG